MDAYTKVSGGTDDIRSIQRWLNGSYWTRDAYTIGPCDGIYSRDVQKSMMIAIQYELGIAAPNGNFGPATQAGLQTKNLGEGSSGLWVQLFSAACVFNSPVPTGTSETGTPTTWRSSYDSKLREWVEIFQRFSKLDVNGRSDYRTWAQLLVSMGDPDRPATGSDTRFEITASRAQWLRNNGYAVVGRYIYDPPGSTLDKEIKPGELNTMFSNGLKVFPIYQDNARQLSDFTYSQGYQHALNAHSLASGYGFNRGTVIYFAVDYDATRDEIDAAIVPYFHGVAASPRLQRQALCARRVRLAERVHRRQPPDRGPLLVRLGHVVGLLRQPRLPDPRELVVQPDQGVQGHQRVGHLRPRP